MFWYPGDNQKFSHIGKLFFPLLFWLWNKKWREISPVGHRWQTNWLGLYPSLTLSKVKKRKFSFDVQLELDRLCFFCDFFFLLIWTNCICYYIKKKCVFFPFYVRTIIKLIAASLIPDRLLGRNSLLPVIYPMRWHKMMKARLLSLQFSAQSFS